MKRLKAYITLLLVALTTLSWGEEKSKAMLLWSEGNEHYSNSEYSQAVKLYNQVVELGIGGVQLYYNLGNAHYKSGNIGRAILNYKRALQLAPNDEDIIYNLKIAEGHTKNRIEPLPDFILTTWVKSLRSSLSSNGWAGWSIAWFALIFITLTVYLLVNTSTKRYIYLSLSFVYLLFFVITTTFAVQLKRNILYSDRAIVISSAEEVKSSPSKDGNSMFIINEGAEVKIVDKVGSWSQIVIASGNKGWIESDAIEKI